jgi:hypothetical protein
MIVKRNIKENLIEAELLTRVRVAGGVAEKVTVRGSRGFFDRLVVLPGGRIVFVECKRPRGGVVSAHQRQRHERYKALGVAVELILSSADIDRLLA